jgi:import receptor subunit TOM22
MVVPQDDSVFVSARNVIANTSFVAWKLAKSTGKAAWIASTTFLLLVAPLIVEMDREQQMVEFENQSLGALTGK